MTPAAEAPVLLALRALGLGDLLTAVPALRALRRGLPEHELVLATPSGLHALARRAEACDRCVAVSGLGGAAVALAGERRPAVAVNLHGSGPQSHAVLLGTAPGRLLAFVHEDHADIGPAWDESEHERVRWCRLLEWYGVPAEPDDLAVAVDPLTGPLAGPLSGATVVHSGASAPARRWPLERWASVVRRLEDGGHRVVVTGGPDEWARARALVHRARLPVDRCLAGRTSAVDLLDVVGAARVVLSGDTGIAHLASAARAPSVVLFGPVSPARWGPPDAPWHRALWHGATGDPHGAAPDPGLLEIDVDEVLDAVATVDRRAPRHVPRPVADIAAAEKCGFVARGQG